MMPVYLVSVKSFPMLYLANRQKSYRAWADFCRNILGSWLTERHWPWPWEEKAARLAFSFWWEEDLLPCWLQQRQKKWRRKRSGGGINICQEVSEPHTPGQGLNESHGWLITSLQSYKSPLSCLFNLFSPTLHSGSTNALCAPMPSVWRVCRKELLQPHSGSAS